MPLLVMCWCLSRLIRHCYLARWTCQLVSENYHLMWRCCLFDKSTCIASCLTCWHGGLCLQLLIPDYVAGFLFGGCICKKHYVIGVVRVCNCLCGVSSASFLCQLWNCYLSFCVCWCLSRLMRQWCDLIWYHFIILLCDINKPFRLWLCIYIHPTPPLQWGRSTCCILANMLDCDIVVGSPVAL